MGHIHAALMAEYAKDAAETDKPWERWQFQVSDSSEWHDATTELTFSSMFKYRRKPVPLCKIEDRDVFPGDKLWHKYDRVWVTVAQFRPSDGVMVDSVISDTGDVFTASWLSWTEPPKAKTVYQWAFKYHDGWFMTAGFFETAEQAKHVSGDASMDFRRLDYTALEVPAWRSRHKT